MDYLLYLIGFIIGLAIFLYVLTAYETGKEKLTKKLAPEKTEKPDNINIPPSHIFFKNRGRPPGERICPLCASTLTQHEPLYASQIKTGTETKILIHGCRHCYKDSAPRK